MGSVHYSYGATYTWDGGGASNDWSDCTNWSTDVCPTASDTVIFDGTSTKDATVDAEFGGSITGLQINSGYTGTITLGRALTIGSGNYTQASGTFTLGSHALTLASANFTISGGTFDAGTGEVVMSGTSRTINVPATQTLYDLTLNMAGNGAAATIASGDTLVVTHALRHVDGAFTGGSIDMQGVYYASSTANGGSTQIEYAQAGDETIVCDNNADVAGLTINKPSDTLTFSCATLGIEIGNFVLQSGSFTLGSKTLELGPNADMTISGGTFDAGTGTVAMTGFGGSRTLDVSTSQTFHDLTVNLTSNGVAVTIASGDTLVVSNSLRHVNGGINGGTIDMQGVYYASSTANGGSSQVTYTQAGDETIVCDNDASVAGLTINKPSGSLAFSCATLGIETGDFILQSGTFLLGSNTFDLRPNADMTISGGTFDAGTGTLMLTGVLPTIDISTSQTLYNLAVNMTGVSYAVSIASGDTLVVTNALRHIDGSINGGTIDMQGVYYASSTANGGSSHVTYAQAGDEEIVCDNNAPIASLVINKPSGTLTFSCPTLVVDSRNGGFALQSGVFSLGSKTINFSSNTDFTISGGTFNTGTGTVMFSGSDFNRSIDVSGSQTFYNLTFDHTNNWSSAIATGDTLLVTGTTTFTDGSVNGSGIVSAQGNVVVASGYDGGSAPLYFTGSSTQNFDLAGATTRYNGDISVDKTGGEVRLLSDLVADATNQDIAVQEGTLNTNGNNITVSGSGGTFVIEDGGVLKLNGDETLSLPILDAGSTAEYVGTGTYTSLALGTTYSNLTFSGSGSYSTTSPLTVTRTFTQSGGAFTAPSSLTVNGDFIRTGGAFTHNNGAVILSGSNQTIDGSTVFYDLTKTVSAADTLFFGAGDTLTIANTWTVQGAAGNLLMLKSTATSTQWSIDPQGARTVSYLNVSDSNNINATAIDVSGGTNIDGGNNTNWDFVGFVNTPPTTSSLSPTAVVNGSWGNDSSPTLSFTTADTDGDTLTYQIQIDDSSDFSSPVVDYTAASAGAGARSFTVGQAAAGGTYTTGTEGQTLSDGSYYWRVRASDGTDTSAYTVANSGGVAFRLDTVAPTAGSVNFSGVTQTQVTATAAGASDAASGIESYLFRETTTGTTSAQSGTATWTLTGLSEGTSYSFVAGVTDAAGNTATTTAAAASTLAASGGSSTSGGGGGLANPDPSAAHSLLNAPRRVVVGETVTVTVTAYDRKGRRLTQGGATVHVFVTGVHNTSHLATDQRDGTYTVSFTAQAPGTDTITATLDGKGVGGDTEGESDGVITLTAAPEAVPASEETSASEEGEGSEAVQEEMTNLMDENMPTASFAPDAPQVGENVVSTAPLTDVQAASPEISDEESEKFPTEVEETAGAVLGEKKSAIGNRFLSAPPSFTPMVLGISIVASIILLPFSLLSIPFSLSTLSTPFTRLWAALMGYGALTRRKRPWGTVYDSVTKQPLDPAYVELLNEKGEVLQTAITDLDGRYGFLVPPGTYYLRATKTNYRFPSLELTGRTHDVLYADLYFGNQVEVVKAGSIVHNIPLDPIGIDWNEEAKKRQRLMHFYQITDPLMVRVLDALFYTGVFFALWSAVVTPELLNFLLLALYGGIFIMRLFIPRPPLYGYIRSRASGTPLSFGIVRILSESGREIATKVTDLYGRYYAFVQDPQVLLSVARQEDETTRELYRKAVTPKKGVVNENVGV